MTRECTDLCQLIITRECTDLCQPIITRECTDLWQPIITRECSEPCQLIRPCDVTLHAVLQKQKRRLLRFPVYYQYSNEIAWIS